MTREPIEYAGKRTFTMAVCAVCLFIFLLALSAVWAGDWRFPIILVACVVIMLAAVGALEVLARVEVGVRALRARRVAPTRPGFSADGPVGRDTTTGPIRGREAGSTHASAVSRPLSRVVGDAGDREAPGVDLSVASSPTALNRGVDGDQLYRGSVLLRSVRRP